jgi:hypothetical protein
VGIAANGQRIFDKPVEDCSGEPRAGRGACEPARIGGAVSKRDHLIEILRVSVLRNAQQRGSSQRCAPQAHRASPDTGTNGIARGGHYALLRHLPVRLAL